MTTTLIERSVEICWPDDAEPANADLFAHNAIVIEAPAEKIWATLIDAANSPGWYSSADKVVVVDDRSGRLGLGANVHVANIRPPSNFVRILASRGQ